MWSTISGCPLGETASPWGLGHGERRGGGKWGSLRHLPSQVRVLMTMTAAVAPGPQPGNPKWDKPRIGWSSQQTHWVANQTWVDVYLFIAPHLSYFIWIFIHFIKETLIHLIPDATTYPVWVLCNLWKMPQITFREFKHSEFLSRMASNFFYRGVVRHSFSPQPVLLFVLNYHSKKWFFPSLSVESKSGDFSKFLSLLLTYKYFSS